MVHVFIRHRVADYTSWKKVFDAFAPTRRAGGELAYTVTHVIGEPNHLCLPEGAADRAPVGHADIDRRAQRHDPEE